MKIYFEHSGQFITAADDEGVYVRCNFRLTDCREDEALDSFVTRHGGEESAAEYLSACYAAK